MSLLLLGLVIGLLVLGTPVAFALSATAIVILVATGEPLSIVPQVFFDSLSIYELAAVPLFVLMSQVLATGKRSRTRSVRYGRWTSGSCSTLPKPKRVSVPPAPV